MNDIQQNKPFTTNQISNTKPNVPRTTNVLTGYVANSLNGSQNKVIAFKKVMAGEKHKEYRLQANIKMLTPLTPTYQNLKCTVRTYFVPNSRVWKNAEAYTAQRGGASVEKPLQIPNMYGKRIPIIQGNDNDYASTFLTNNETWRDCFAASYIPRIETYTVYNTQNENLTNDRGYLPAASILPLRGRIAIYNDLERNKEYDEELQEYDSDEVTDEEWSSYMPTDEAHPMDIYFMRGRKNNNYYTDYRTELQGYDLEIPSGTELNSDSAMLNWESWMAKVAEVRSQAENSQKTDWQIISEIRGSKKLTEGKVQLIGQQTFNLNYAAITQNTYNTNETISEEFRVMGQQGAYSYTEVNIPLYAGMEFVEEGYIHVIMQVTADTVYEKGFDRNELNVTPFDEYRPDLLDDKKDVLYEIETDTEDMTTDDFSRVIGFKRKYSELFKLPNIIGGDMTSDNYTQVLTTETQSGNQVVGNDLESEIITQKTFQFFEKSRYYWNGGLTGQLRVPKKPWLDYTDLLINRNQAILNKVIYYDEDPINGYQGNSMKISGQNQIFFVGITTCIAELPVDSSISQNYTTWGEH